MPGSRHRLPRPVPAAPDLRAALLRGRPGHRRELLPRPPPHRPQGRAAPVLHRAGRHRLLRARARVLRLRRRALRDPAQRRRSTRSTRSRGSGTPAATRGRTSATSPAPSRATSRSRRWTTSTTCAREMSLNLERVGVPVELHHHEVASGGQGEIGIQFDTLLAMADKLMTFKYVLKSTAWEAGKSADVHAQAGVRGQRLGHAHPPVAVEGRRAAVLRRDRVRRAVATWPAGTSAACSTTRPRCWRSPTRRPTASSGWCRATRRR